MAQDNERVQGVQNRPDLLLFYCPGCEEPHQVTVGSSQTWQWNGDRVRVTLAPSVLIRSGHYAQEGAGSCWCTYNAARPNDPAPFVCRVCHSFVRDGQIQFLGDCTHALVGQTVDLPTWNSVMRGER